MSDKQADPVQFSLFAEHIMHEMAKTVPLDIGTYEMMQCAQAIEPLVAKLQWQLGAMTSYAEAALSQLKNGRGSFDITGFNLLIPEAKEILKVLDKC